MNTIIGVTVLLKDLKFAFVSSEPVCDRWLPVVKARDWYKDSILNASSPHFAISYNIWA